MTVRILVTSDWHLDASTAGHDRFDDLDAAVRETVAEASRMACTHYLFLGDLSDPDTSRAHRSVAVAVWAALTLSARGVRSVWLAGNHDVIDDGSGLSTLAPLAELSDVAHVSVYARPTVVQLARGVGLVALPYAARSGAYDPEKFVRGCAGPLDALGCRQVIVAGHLNLAGIAPGSETEDMPRGREVLFPLAACREVLPGALLLNGHYHRGQVYEGVHIPGSLERLTFGEADHDPGWLVVEVSP